jgi:hypothetical protein
MGVGPAQGDFSWWSNSEADLTTRACLFDDLFVFESDGTFRNIMGTETWVETWQAGFEGCGTPVAPHNGSTAATWSYDGSSLTITGTGAHIGLPKVSFYPNPVSDNLIIELPESKCRIRIFSIKGNLMDEWQSNSAKVNYNMSTYLPGIYIIEVTLINSRKKYNILRK